MNPIPPTPFLRQGVTKVQPLRGFRVVGLSLLWAAKRKGDCSPHARKPCSLPPGGGLAFPWDGPAET
jgi:hypothetical protein